MFDTTVIGKNTGNKVYKTKEPDVHLMESQSKYCQSIKIRHDNPFDGFGTLLEIDGKEPIWKICTIQIGCDATRMSVQERLPERNDQGQVVFQWIDYWPKEIDVEVGAFSVVQKNACRFGIDVSRPDFDKVLELNCPETMLLIDGYRPYSTLCTIHFEEGKICQAVIVHNIQPLPKPEIVPHA